MRTLTKHTFTEKELHLESLILQFNFELIYTTSSEEIRMWLNMTEGNRYATLGYQINHRGYIAHVTLAEAQQLLANKN